MGLRQYTFIGLLCILICSINSNSKALNIFLLFFSFLILLMTYQIIRTNTGNASHTDFILSLSNARCMLDDCTSGFSVICAYLYQYFGNIIVADQANFLFSEQTRNFGIGCYSFSHVCRIYDIFIGSSYHLDSVDRLYTFYIETLNVFPQLWSGALSNAILDFGSFFGPIFYITYFTFITFILLRVRNSYSNQTQLIFNKCKINFVFVLLIYSVILPPFYEFFIYFAVLYLMFPLNFIFLKKSKGSNIEI